MTNDNTIKQDIKKLKQNKLFLTIFILLFVSMLFWIIVSLVSSQSTEKISSELTLIAKPLTPVIDTDVFTQIEEKRIYSEDELSSFTIYKVIVSRDGRTQTVVPIEVTIDDLEPKEDQNSRQPTRSLLNDAVTQEEEERSEPTQIEEPTPEPTNPPSESSDSPSETSSPSESSLDTQL